MKKINKWGQYVTLHSKVVEFKNRGHWFILWLFRIHKPVFHKGESELDMLVKENVIVVVNNHGEFSSLLVLLTDDIH